MKLVVALGGNALLHRGEAPSAANQQSGAVAQIATRLREWVDTLARAPG